MSRIDTIFSDARTNKKRLVMPFVCAGHPGPESLPELLGAMQRAGAGIVEVGFPFSDPIADGPVIASAMHKALETGMTPQRVFEQVASIRDALDIGLVAMVSTSIVYKTGGPEGFPSQAAQAGFDGVIYPDVPLSQAQVYLDGAAKAGLSAAMLIAPTTPPKRAQEIANACSGFLYLLARTGITGERGEAPEIEKRVAQLRQWTRTPIACGFGISTPTHVQSVITHADAAIVGSALIRRIDQAAQQGHNPIEAAEEFVLELAAAAMQPS